MFDAACTKIIKAEKTESKEWAPAVFDGLIYGTVYVKRDESSAGYQLSKEVIKVTINDNWVNGDDNRTMRLCGQAALHPAVLIPEITRV